jgi:hypothetical protein
MVGSDGQDGIEKTEGPNIPPGKNNGRESVTLSGKELIQLVIFTPVVFTWLFLAARIVWSASSNPETLDNIEGL